MIRRPVLAVAAIVAGAVGFTLIISATSPDPEPTGTCDVIVTREATLDVVLAATPEHVSVCLIPEGGLSR